MYCQIKLVPVSPKISGLVFETSKELRILVKIRFMSEIIFLIEEADEGGFIAKAVSESIITQAETLEDLKNLVKDAVRCHFDIDKLPKLIRFHFVRDEVFAV